MTWRDRRPEVPTSVPEGEVWIFVRDEPDEFGHQHFSAFWAEANQWRGGNGVSGQVFFASVAEFAARCRKGEDE